LASIGRLTGVIGIGIHAGTEYPDCSPAFVDAMQRLLDVYSGGEVQLDAPFLSWSKPEIWEYARRLGVPLDATYSCEFGPRPCGQCLSCV
jgi:7-cyano-7-deazaguanine synthase